MYYYVTRVAPTWEMTWFFILHGVAVAAEVVVKKVVPEKMRLHSVVSGALAMGFLAVTAIWLLLPPLMRNDVDEKAIGESKDQPMENELHNFIKVWILAIISLCYCFYISSKLPKGIFKLISLTPIFIFFLYLPLTVSSVHLVGITAFFLSWLANFKLLLFCFDQPPLSPPPSNLFHFISLASLPIKLQQKIPSQNKSKPPQRSILFAIKVLILALLYHCYNYKRNLHKNVVLAMYGVHIYIELELTLALAAIPARAMFGLEIEPQFNEPLLTTSLQDFWGRRWNLIVTSILRPTVYYPTRLLLVWSDQGGLLCRRSSPCLSSPA
ncbi:hypothetical protein Gotur_016718 [Gossypium turneri]